MNRLYLAEKAPFIFLWYIDDADATDDLIWETKEKKDMFGVMSGEP